MDDIQGNIFLRIIGKITHLSCSFGAVCIFICALTIFWEIVARSVFNAPTQWSFELSIYLFIVFTFSCMAEIQARNRHVHVDLFISNLCSRTYKIWQLVLLSTSLFFCVILTYYAAEFAWKSFNYSETSPTIWGPPIWPVKLFVPFGFFVLGLQFVKDIVITVATIKNEPLKRQEGLIQSPVFLCITFFVIIGSCILLSESFPVATFITLLLTFLFFGMPIFIALGLTGAFGLVMAFGGTEILVALPKISYSSMDSFAVICVPLFVMCGEILNRSGAGQELYDMASKWLQKLDGGLAIATIASCAVFAAISASSVATTFTIGIVALASLEKFNYRKSVACGAVAAGGTLGIMIPPSGAMIFYSAVTEESLGKLFLAGVFPGMVMVLLFSLYIYVSSRITRKKYPVKQEKYATWPEKFQAVWDAKWALFAPLIIIGGIYAGFFTPMEAASVAVIYSLLMVIGRRKIRLRDLSTLIRNCSASSVALLVIVFSAMIIGYYLTMMNLPSRVIDFVSQANLPNGGVIMLLMCGFVLLGMFLEVISIILITMPIVYPMITALGIDGIWFAVLMTITMEMACITPPIGINLFVIQGIDRTPFRTIVQGVWPFFVMMIIGLLIIYFFPGLSTWLPNRMIQ